VTNRTGTTPEEYLDRLVRIFREVNEREGRRKPLDLIGDCYARSAKGAATTQKRV
jgi:hypothetical protein